MSSPIPSEIPQIVVTPASLFLMDVETNLCNDWFFRFKPLDYDLEITLSGYMLTQLFKWAVKSGFVVINGTYTIQGATQRRKYNAEKSKSSLEKKNGTSLATPGQNS